MLGAYTVGTPSIQASDTSVSSVRHLYQYRTLQNKQSKRQQANSGGALVALRGRKQNDYERHEKPGYTAKKKEYFHIINLIRSDKSRVYLATTR